MPALKQAGAASWSQTLRLPRSRFPPRPVFADRARYLKQCCDDLYEWQRTTEPPRRDTFILHDGPPYANGSLHVGHALNKILKDITCRTRLLKGQRVNYVPGWDCHGLPIELKALQQKNLQPSLERNPASAAWTRDVARSLATRTVEEQKAGFRQWAIMGDWNNAWTTFDKEFELSQLRVFKTMLESGLIYQSNKPVYWSPSSRTALAEAELEYNPEHESRAAFVKFPLLGIPVALKETVAGQGRAISTAIWTTTPWTLVANRAIAVHDSFEYSVVQSDQHGILIAATSRIPELEKACKEEFAGKTLKTIEGRDLIGATYSNPIMKHQSNSFPIVHAPFVSSDSGTGVVHMAPGHGMEDYKTCRAHGIEPYAPIDDTGCFTKEALPHNPQMLLGKAVLAEGNLAVLDLLASSDALIQSHVYRHSYPYDWRSKQPVITRATSQWFANVEGIRPATLQSLSNVEFVPEAGRERLSSFVRTRTEWCISRQRPWGVPIPALYERESGKAVMTPESVEHIMSVMEERGSDTWWTDDPFASAWVLPSMRGSGQFFRGQDTMDVWFDSGTSWTQMPTDRYGQPRVADVYLEGSDQHRGWFQSSLLTRIACQSAEKRRDQPVAPYKTLITHGFTLDQHGRKMSKSVGNVIGPEEIMQGTLLPSIKRKRGSQNKDSDVTYDALGPDALRMWVAGSDYTRDVVISQTVLQAVNNSILKLRVTFKLLLGFLDTHQARDPLYFKDLELNDQLALVQLQRIATLVRGSFEGFEYHKAVNAINNYIAIDLSAGYVEAIKDRMYTDAALSPRRVQTQAVVWQIFKQLADMLYPITPLLIEEACDHLPEQLSYHPAQSAWTEPARHELGIIGEWQSDTIDKLMPYLGEVIATVKALQEISRSEKNMGSSLQSNVIVNTSSAPIMRELFKKNRNAIEDMLVVSQLHVSSEPASSLVPGAAWSYTRSIKVNGESADVIVRSPSQEKCTRCWRYTVLPENTLEDQLCLRCLGVLNGLRSGQPHLFAEKPQLDAAARACKGHDDPEIQRHWHFE